MNGHLLIGDETEGAAAVTEAGRAFLAGELGIELGPAAGRRPLCRTCLDWSERRPHLAGRFGAALCRRSLELGWVAAMPYTRAVAITPLGRQGFTRTFGLDLA